MIFQNFWTVPKIYKEQLDFDFVSKTKITFGWIRSPCFKHASLSVLLNSGRMINFETIVKNTLENHPHFLGLAQQ